jgi:hypothetical protein
MKRYHVITGLILGIIFGMGTVLLSGQDNGDEKPAEVEAKLEEILGTDTNWKMTIFKDLRYHMSCAEVQKYFAGIDCNITKKWRYAKYPGNVSEAIKEYRFTFLEGKLERAGIIFSRKITDSEHFATALLNVAQRKWGTLSPDRLNRKYKFWYNSDRDSVSLSEYRDNWKLEVSLLKRDTGEVYSGTMNEADIRASLARLLGAPERWLIPSLTQFTRGMTCEDVKRVYKTLKGCDPEKKYSRGEVTIQKHDLIHALKFAFREGALVSATMIFHRQLDREMFKKVSLPLFEEKWGKVKPEKRNNDIITVYVPGAGIAQRSFMNDHWEIKQDFPRR